MVQTKYKPATLAKWFINHVDRYAEDDITHLKLQKRTANALAGIKGTRLTYRDSSVPADRA